MNRTRRVVPLALVALIRCRDRPPMPAAETGAGATATSIRDFVLAMLKEKGIGR